MLPVALLVPLIVSGCGDQNVLDPHSHAERRISKLWWVMMTGAWIGFGLVVVLLFLVLGAFRKPRDLKYLIGWACSSWPSLLIVTKRVCNELRAGERVESERRAAEAEAALEARLVGAGTLVPGSGELRR